MSSAENREIKFRAWDNGLNIMVDSLSISALLNGGSYEYTTKSEIAKGSTKTIIVQGDPFNNKNLHMMQYTGLKDKKGVEIYEGDIVDKGYANIYVSDNIGEVKMSIEYDSDGWRHGKWYGWIVSHISPPHYNSSLLDVAGDCNVIGNIYESPELLKQGKARNDSN